MYGGLGPGSEPLPPLLKEVELLQPLRDGLWRPVDDEAGRPLDARDVVVSKGLLLRSPLPEAIVELAEGFCARKNALGKQQRQNSQIPQEGQGSSKGKDSCIESQCIRARHLATKDNPGAPYLGRFLCEMLERHQSELFPGGMGTHVRGTEILSVSFFASAKGRLIDIPSL